MAQIKTNSIAFVANVGWSIYNFRKDIIKYFIDRGYKVIVITKFDQYIGKLEEMGCECIDLKRMDFKGKNPLNDLLLIFEFYKIFKKIKIDYALLYTPKANIYASIAARFSSTACIPTINGLGTVFNPEQKVWVQKVVTLLYKFAFGKSKTIFFQNNDDMHFFVRKGIINENKNIKVVKGSGVNTDIFYQKKYEIKDHIVFGYAARMLKEKGIFEFIQAATHIKLKFPNMVFAIIGASSFSPGNIDEKQIAIAEENGIVTYWGATDEMYLTLDNVDILVLPSFYREGIPRILIEGLSKGLPIITTNNVGCRETVEEGKNGFLIPIKNAIALEEAMLKMISMSHEQRVVMGNASREKALREFENDFIFSEYAKVISAS